jgi:GNAT superfamily N-acetyltransferase
MNPTIAALSRSLDSGHPHWIETLRDQTRVLIRQIGPRDLEAERRFIESMSLQTRRLRFLGEIRHPSEALLLRPTTPDPRRDVAFAAVLPEDGHEPVLGMARYRRCTDGLGCECALAVLDEWHHKGLGTVLLRHLIEMARAGGFRYIYSIDSVENTEMAALARQLGFESSWGEDEPTQLRHTLRLGASRAGNAA